MGKVLVEATIANLTDLYNAKDGLIPDNQVRSVNVADALVDTGATNLSLPAGMIEKLGLHCLGNRRARTGAGTIEMRVFGTARVTVQGRDCACDVTEVPDGSPVLIGQIPLEVMDFVIDMQGRKLTGNPEHGGEQMIEHY